MGVTKYTEAELVERATLILADNFPGRALHKLSFLGQQAVSAAQLLAAVQQAVAEADRDAVPVTEVVAGVLRSRCSSERLDSWAEFFGLPSNRGAGLYGRNAATAATGGVGTATGGAGVVVPTGAQLVSPDGATTFELTAGFTIPQGGSVTSADTGAAHRLRVVASHHAKGVPTINRMIVVNEASLTVSQSACQSSSEKVMAQAHIRNEQ